MKTRTPWQVTRSVWYALFMREAIARTMADRMAWFWMLAEPIAMIAVMVLIRSVALGGQHVSGAHFIPWLITGLLGFFLFRENMMRSIGAIEANQGLFAYRQVKPVDTVLVRCFLEGLLKAFIFLLFIFSGLILGFSLIPVDPFGALFFWASLWILGAGAGLTLSALSKLVPELAKVVRIISFPLMILSGSIIPLQLIPHDLQPYILLNPVAHGVELLRISFFSRYQSLAGIDPTYLWYWALGLFFVGLGLQIRFEQKLKAQ